MFNINSEETTKKIESFMRDAFKKENCKDVLIGLSGGVDSATSAILAVRVLSREHVYPVLLPYGKLNPEGERDALLLIKSLEIPLKNVTTVDIKPFSDSVINSDLSMDEGRKGNVMARMRMVVLYDLSKKHNYLVVGTENKSEHLLGYYTRFGDEASDIEPLKELYKTQVYMLAKHIGVPKEIIDKSPTAGLWEGQTDEGEFGFPYKIADEILFLYKEKGLEKNEIILKGYDKKIVERVWWWVEKGEFKDRVPYVFRP